MTEGHERAVSFLKNSIRKGIIHHAYLIKGPERIGKETLSIDMACAINCQNEEKPCDMCETCRKIRTRVHPDVKIYENPGISDIREIEKDVSISPFESPHKIYIIKGDGMGVEAMNALLKTLEEPSSWAVIIINSSRPLLPTIISRCQVIELSYPAREVIEGVLTRRGAEPERAYFLSKICGGRIGWAIEAFQDEEVLRERAEIIERLIDVLSSGLTEKLKFAEEFLKMEKDEVIFLWKMIMRDLIFTKIGLYEKIVNIDFEDRLKDLARKISAHEMRVYLSSLLNFGRISEGNINERLYLESLFLGAL